MTENAPSTTPAKARCCTPGMVYWIERGDRMVALAMAMANGDWMLTDGEEKPLTRERFKSPKGVAKAADRLRIGVAA